MTQKIIATDTFVTDFDGLSFSDFEKLGEFEKFDFTSDKEGDARLKEASAVITNKFVINESILDACPNIKYIGVTATGTNNVDIPLAKERGITVTNVPGYSTDSVAQLVFAYILDAFSKLPLNSSSSLIDTYKTSKYFSLQESPALELAGKNLLILGMGDIGKKVSVIGKAFGLNILQATLPGREYSKEERDSRLSLDDALSKADIISIHCPLTDSTHELINNQSLSKLKQTAILINTARGPIINEADLASALKSSFLAHAYLDVLTEEPPNPSNPLLSAPNCTITPHLAWATKEARQRLVKEAALNLEAWIEGKARNSL